jgi:hypothetical protein
VKLLGTYEPVLLGWDDRSAVLDPRFAGRVISGGIFRPCVLVRGRVAGTWSLQGKRVSADVWAPRISQRALRAEIAGVERFLDG